MATCRIKRNDNGRITKVSNADGTEAKLFNEIASHPLVENEEEALRMFKSSLTKKGEGVIDLVHRVDGEIILFYKDALKKAKEGERIEVGFYKPEKGSNFLPIMEINKTTDRSSKEGFINHMIETNVLSPKKKKTKDGYKFQAAGYTTNAKVVNAEILRDNAVAYLGVRGVQKDGTTFGLNKTNDKTKVLSHDGSMVEFTREELDGMSYEELQKVTPYALDYIMAREYANNRPAYGFKQPERELPNRSEEDLKSLLKNFLTKIGVSTMSIEQYIENYNIKNGVDPDVNALADIANKVVAFNNGEMGLEALTEEVAHFINEAMPQEEVQSILSEIHKSDEWAEHAEAYREVYSKRYSGEKLDQAVRREILGKVVANSILNNFQSQNVSETQRGFMEKALAILTKFFERIQAYFKPEYKQELDSYLDSVNRIVRADNIADSLNTSNFEGNEFVLYSMTKKTAPPSSIKLSAQKAIAVLEDQIQHSLSRAKKGSSLNRQKLNSLQDKLENAQELSAIADIKSLTDTYILMLQKAIEDAKKNNKSYIFTQEENIIFQALKNQLIPSLNEITSLIKGEKANNTEWQKLKEELKNTVSEFNEFSGEAAKQDITSIDNLIDKIMIRHELPESQRKFMEEWVNTAEADTNWFHANFGMLTHSKDGLLNLAGAIQKDISTQSNINWQDSTKKYQQRLKKLGVSEKEISKFVDGNFIVSEYDFNKFENVLERLEAITYKEASQSKLTVDEIIEQKKEGTLEPLTSAQEVVQKRRLKDLRNPLLERKFKSSYYDQFENKLGQLGISQAGIKFIMNYYGDMSQFKRAAQQVVTDANGKEKMIMDFSQLSEQDKALRDQLIKERANAKSYFTERGTLKKGLMEDANGEVVADPDVELSHEAQVALDLNKLDSNRDSSIDNNKDGFPPVFLNTIRHLEETEGREAALEFLQMNSFIGFSQDYWDTLDMDNSSSVLSRLEEFVSKNPSDLKAEELLRKLRNDRNRLRSIIKVYRSKNNPSEVDVDVMPQITKDTVKELQESVSDSYRRAMEITKDMPKVAQQGDKTTVSSVNDAYFKKLQDLNAYISYETDSIEEINRKIKDEVEFASKHMTDSNRLEVANAVESLRLFSSGFESKVSNTVQKSIDELGYELESLTEPQVARVIENIVRNRLLPYYTRFAPEQYDFFMSEIAVEGDNLADVLPEALEKYNFIEVNPNYSFFDETQNANMNPNYVENFEGGYLQPKKDLSSSDVSNVLSRIPFKEEQDKIRSIISEGGTNFRSQKFNELFGNNTSGKMWEAYQATLDYNRSALDAMGVGNSYNKYTLPQIKKNRLERVSKFVKGANLTQLQEALREELTYTEDDKVQGEKSKFGDSVKIIPKMYVDRIQNPNDVSNELFYSLAARARESYLREARVEHYGDFMAIYDKIVNREYKGKGDKPENTLKMFESAMDYSLFGIKETAMYPIETMFGTIDIAKLARKILGFIKFRNLGLNLVIPITSYLTGRTTREIEKWVGEHMDARSQKLGDAEFRKHSRAAISEIGEINTESKLSVMGQYFQAFDMEESFQNSNYNKLTRFLPRVGMALHTGANFPIYGSTLFGVLHDYRVANGTILRFNQFERQKLADGKSKKEIKEEWRQLEENAIYNFINVKDGEVIFDDAAIQKQILDENGNAISNEAYKEFKENKIQAIRAHISNVVTNIDGQIPMEARVHAQRHFALNYFMTHRGWLSIVASRRFKNRHLNTETGEVEEGSYRTVWNFMGKYLKQFKKGNFTNFVKNWKQVYDNADPEEAQLIRRNMKRVGIEMAALNGLMLLGFLLNGLADDEENEDSYGIQGLSYLFNRTLNELSSAQLGSINNFSEVIESPFVGWNTVKTFTDVGDLFNGDEVKYGSYRGLSHRERFLTKIVPGAKQIHDLSSAAQVKKMRDTYMFYNNANFNYTPLGNLYWLGEDN